jgi:hypothetical protein
VSLGNQINIVYEPDVSVLGALKKETELQKEQAKQYRALD